MAQEEELFDKNFGVDATVGMVARFGRIAFRGEDSRSILDPGSVLAAFIVRTLAESV